MRDFIQKVRECKSKQDERQMVSEASALIRTALKEGSEFRFRNVVRIVKNIFCEIFWDLEDVGRRGGGGKKGEGCLVFSTFFLFPPPLPFASF